jgi:hypothetical protein
MATILGFHFDARWGLAAGRRMTMPSLLPVGIGAENTSRNLQFFPNYLMTAATGGTIATSGVFPWPLLRWHWCRKVRLDISAGPAGGDKARRSLRWFRRSLDAIHDSLPVL